MTTTKMTNRFKTIVAIDPGKSGAWAIHRFNNLALIKMPPTAKEIHKELKAMTDPLVFIESVQHWAYEEPEKKMAIAKLEKNYNSILDACEIHDIPFVKVPAVTWRKGLKMPKVEDYSKRKSANKEFAMQFTDRKLTLQTTDAFLIMLFALDKIKTNPDWVIDKMKGV